MKDYTNEETTEGMRLFFTATLKKKKKKQILFREMAETADVALRWFIYNIKVGLVYDWGAPLVMF